MPEEEAKEEGGGDFYVYDEKTNNFIAKNAGELEEAANEMMRVPNFSYAGDLDALKY